MTPPETHTVDGQAHEPIRLLVFSASLREGSLNSRPADLGRGDDREPRSRSRSSAHERVRLPLLQPRRAERELSHWRGEFRARLEACDGFVVSAPEYNASMPGVLKECDRLDLSLQPSAIQRAVRTAVVGTAVDGRRRSRAVGLASPLRAPGRPHLPGQVLARPGAHRLEARGRIANQQLQERFESNIADFMDSVEAAKHHPCIKRAWVEYLGERPEPAIDRVE